MKYLKYLRYLNITHITEHNFCQKQMKASNSPRPPRWVFLAVEATQAE